MTSIPLLARSPLIPDVRMPLLTGLPSGMTFTRASTGTYFGSDWLIHTAADNEPRFEFHPVTLQPVGLLLEESRTNVHPNSFLISGWSNNSSTVTDNFYASPDGAQNASRIVGAAQYNGRYRLLPGLTASGTYAVSGYVKSFSGSPIIRVGLDKVEGAGLSNGYLDIKTSTGGIYGYGAAAYDMYSVLLPNGWTYFRYRCVMGAEQTSAAYVAYAINSGSTFSVWGCQVEAGAFPTSYIPTSGSAVTRAADSLYTTNIPWFNPSEGTLGAVGIPHYSIPAHRSYLAGFSDGTVNNVIANLIETTGRPIGGNVIAGTVSISGGTLPIVTANRVVKSAVVYKAAANKVFSGGAADTAGAFGPSGVPSGISRLDIGGGTIANRQFNGTIQGISYYNRALSAAELQRITT